MRIILVDDHPLLRNGLANILNSQPDLEVAGEAGSIKEAIAMVEAHDPDLVIMDLGLPDGSGMDAIPRILAKKPETQIVILTINGSEQLAFTALRLGAKGFLLKDISAPALLSSVRGLGRGELAVSRAILSRFVTEAAHFHSPRGAHENRPDSTLTGRELELLAELSNGASNSEIGQRLSISENTVKIHVHNILHKLNLESRQQAAAFARRHGLGQNDLGESEPETIQQGESSRRPAGE